jgi:hypothetical protein
VGSYFVERGRPQITIWRRRIACWMPKATDTHSEYVTHVAFPLQKWSRERASLLLHCLSCSKLVHATPPKFGRHRYGPCFPSRCQHMLLVMAVCQALFKRRSLYRLHSNFFVNILSLIFILHCGTVCLFVCAAEQPSDTHVGLQSLHTLGYSWRMGV